jgi:hypothetical protein
MDHDERRKTKELADSCRGNFGTLAMSNHNAGYIGFVFENLDDFKRACAGIVLEREPTCSGGKFILHVPHVQPIGGERVVRAPVGENADSGSWRWK